MKILFLTLVLALMLMSGSSLKCYKCNSGLGEKCFLLPDPCNWQNACISSVSKTGTSVTKRCISMAECVNLKQNPDYNVHCCRTDFCNRAP
ncbi:probable weak neurotoxin 3FTx-Lio1 [Tachysurus fulvidraco]|uniref:probable weak neurotoxin 3FTx-Lio1 n=1 Tax=Tachysurus fulvidraco TaxID=1234273 RepID=UPI001FEF965D|nr:probable weak neurotoxin 3FTx-Lio1 [Tachysurus fulvidraco]